MYYLYKIVLLYSHVNSKEMASILLSSHTPIHAVAHQLECGNTVVTVVLRKGLTV